ncbi:transposase [Chroococcidiopsis sp. FACHB-1243]|nr:transposase [Chroococcidiopsis sp. [FACHB-1243]]
MLGQAIDAGVGARWVGADALYGTDHRLRQFIEARGLHYVLAVNCDQTIWVDKSQHPCRCNYEENRRVSDRNKTAFLKHLTPAIDINLALEKYPYGNCILGEPDKTIQRIYLNFAVFVELQLCCQRNNQLPLKIL